MEAEGRYESKKVEGVFDIESDQRAQGLTVRRKSASCLTYSKRMADEQQR